jgi:hypothetical protein
MLCCAVGASFAICVRHGLGLPYPAVTVCWWSQVAALLGKIGGNLTQQCHQQCPSAATAHPRGAANNQGLALCVSYIAHGTRASLDVEVSRCPPLDGTSNWSKKPKQNKNSQNYHQIKKF